MHLRMTAQDESLKRLSFIRRNHPFLRALGFLAAGDMTLDLPGGIRLHYAGKKGGTHAHMRFHDWKPLDRLVTCGDLGWGEDYALGLWETDDLAALMNFVAENADALEAFSNGNASFRLIQRLKRRVFSNSPARSRKNVHKHYDLGNAFYSQWLDEGMTYSCALFNQNPSLTLESAQRAKYARILDRLSPQPSDHILEIGCGWGAFMEAAAHCGARVTGLTLSEEQAIWARKRLSDKKLDAKAQIQLEDYRKVGGLYDHIVSIGMFEHVGEAFWGTYMNYLYDRLKPGGQAMVQTIIIRDDLFGFYKAGSGFIREHIFPGGMLPPRKRFEEEAVKAGFAVRDVFHFGQDYAITLAKWLERFDSRLPEIRSLGYCEAFIRKWRFYLTYCAAMFRAGRIDVMQVHLERSQ
jgi:cyclopropane-fatty-acyl-phospholipid synthase